MLKNCETKYILDFKIVNIDGKKVLDYKTIQYSSLDKVYIDINLIRKIIFNIIYLEKDLKKYLLNIDDILLDENYIFIGKENIKFIYLPNYGINIYNQLNYLFKFILKNIDYKSKELIGFIYTIYNMIEKRESLNAIYEYIVQECNETKVESYREDFTFNSNIEDDEIIEKDNIIKNKKVIYIALGLIIIVGLLFINIKIEYIIGVILFFGTFIYVFYKLDNIKDIFYGRLENIIDFSFFNKNDKNNIIAIALHDDIGSIININKFPFFIGSDIESDYVINDVNVEKVHGKIFIKKNKIFIKDLKTKTGIYVNDILVNKVKLFYGDKIHIGNRQFIVEKGES